MTKKNKDNKELNSNKNVILIVAVILLLIGGYFGYKAILFISNNKSVSKEEHTLTDVLEINVNREYSNVDAEGIFMRLPDELIYNKEESQKHDTYRYYKNYVTAEDCDAWISFGESDLSIEKVLDASKSQVKMMEKYVENEYYLFRYYVMHANDEISIFTESDKMKLYYLSRKYYEILVHDKTNFELAGDLQGVLNVGDNTFNVYLFDNEREKMFTITFWNDNEEYFNYSNVIDILETVYFG